MPLKKGLEFLGKSLMLDMLSTGVSYGTSELCKKLNLPEPITLLLSGMTGLSVSIIGGKYVFKNAKGRVIFEDNVDSVEDKLVKDVIRKIENNEIELSNNIQKGNYGEMKMDIYFSEREYKRISLDRVTDINAPVHRGIDGVYYNPDGEPPYIIAEAKYNTSQLKITKDGKQMEDSWINGSGRLENAVGKDVADDIFLEGYGKILVNIKSNGELIMKNLE